MRIAFITQDYIPETGGIETYSFELCSRLNDMVDFLLVFAPEKEGARETDSQTSIPTLRIPVRNTLLFLPLLFLFPFYAARNNLNTSFHSQWQTLLPAILAKKMGIIKHIAVAAHARELLLNPFGSSVAKKLYRWYKNKMMSQVDLFFPVSKYTADLLVNEGVERNKIKVVINGTDNKKFFPKNSGYLKQELGLENKKIILTISRLVKRKGIDTVLRALPTVLKQVENAHYLVVGTGPQKDSLEKMVSELGVSDHVTFTGWVDYDKLNDYYNICELFVMPSKTTPPDVEGFGIVFLEANACKKPVIGSDSGGIPSAIIHNETGLIISEDNEEELSEALIYLLNEEKKATILGEKGYQRVLKEANWNNTAIRIYNFLKDLTQSR